MRADLHLHTEASDGALGAAEMIRLAAQAGMRVVSITDHDVVSGIRSAQAAGQAQGIQVIPGIELSCGKGEEVHLLGYGLNPDDPELARLLNREMENRLNRMNQMLEKLRPLGIEIAPEEIRSAGSRFMGRMNLAAAMVERGHVESIRQAFSRYLNPGKPGFVPRERLGIAEAIAALSEMGATVSLAHPGRLKMSVHDLTTMLPEWKAAGLAGLEAYHTSHNEAEMIQYDRLARVNGLLVTGGSDSHGREGGAQIGDHLPGWRTVDEDVARLMERTA